MLPVFAGLLILLLPSNLVLSAKTRALKGEGVVGGLPTKSGEIKYVVSIQHSTVPRQPFSPICTGGIIGKRYILTAAHCFYIQKSDKFRYGQFKIVAGKNDLNANDTSSVEILVKKIYIPKNYNNLCYSNLDPLVADIAVLKLNAPLDLDHNDKLEKLFLPKVNASNPDDNIPYVNTYAKIAGYGYDKIGFAYWKNGSKMVFGKSSHQLLKAQTIIIDQTKCVQSYYHRKVLMSNLCARVINYSNNIVQGICGGDSGSPLVSNNNTVIGVAIAAIEECNENKTPGLYTRVTSYVPFIRNAKNNVTDNMKVYTAHEKYTVFFKTN